MRYNIAMYCNPRLTAVIRWQKSCHEMKKYEVIFYNKSYYEWVKFIQDL